MKSGDNFFRAGVPGSVDESPDDRIARIWMPFLEMPIKD